MIYVLYALQAFCAIGWLTAVVFSGIMLNRKLSCVGWWFYRRAMAAAERSRAERAQFLGRPWERPAGCQAAGSLTGAGAITTRTVIVYTDDPGHNPWTLPRS